MYLLRVVTNINITFLSGYVLA